MKILIFDDHPLIINAITHTIEKLYQKSTIFKCTNIEDAKSTIENRTITYAICDLQITTGKSTIIPELCVKNKIVTMIYTSHINRTIYMKTKEIGINILVSKCSSTEEFIFGINSMINQKEFYCTNVIKTITTTNDELPIEKLSGSKNQFKILKLLNSGLTQSEVANHLNLSERTIINHLSILRDINNCNTTAELLRRYIFWE